LPGGDCGTDPIPPEELSSGFSLIKLTKMCPNRTKKKGKKKKRKRKEKKKMREENELTLFVARFSSASPPSPTCPSL
jgi:hypothetical protein